MAISAESKDVCPHCNTSNRFEYAVNTTQNIVHRHTLVANSQNKTLELCRCTACGDLIIFLDYKMIYPVGTKRGPCPLEVPDLISCDYVEACLVEPYSKKAAAALIRRCLQNVLHDQRIKKRNLNEEIDEAIKGLPSHLSSAVDSIRVVGNFAAHPTKHTNTGEIVDVEDGETEWLLDVIEQLFDFYYVAPNKLKEKRDALNSKLRGLGKPELK